MDRVRILYNSKRIKTKLTVALIGQSVCSPGCGNITRRNSIKTVNIFSQTMKLLLSLLLTQNTVERLWPHRNDKGFRLHFYPSTDSLDLGQAREGFYRKCVVSSTSVNYKGNLDS